jgi:hypothetical protein
MYTPSLIDKYEKKKIYCGRCIQERIHRNDPDWEYEKEFSYKIKKLTEKDKKDLELLRLFFV